ELPRTLYFDITMNMETFDVVSKVYEDIEMTILNGTWSNTFANGPVWAGGSWLTYEYVNGPTETTSGLRTGYSGWHLTDNITTEFYAYDPEENITYGPYDTYNDTTAFIDGVDPDPEDPNPADSWDDIGPFTRFRMRFYFLIMGFALLFGPLFVFSYRRPTGYAFVIGLFIMLVGFSFLIHVGSV
ncbi:unnamed protein product, partial [marine sediment metagenome]